MPSDTILLLENMESVADQSGQVDVFNWKYALIYAGLGTAVGVTLTISSVYIYKEYFQKPAIGITADYVFQIRLMIVFYVSN